MPLRKYQSHRVVEAALITAYEYAGNWPPPPNQTIEVTAGGEAYALPVTRFGKFKPTEGWLMKYPPTDGQTESYLSFCPSGAFSDGYAEVRDSETTEELCTDLQAAGALMIKSVVDEAIEAVRKLNKAKPSRELAVAITNLETGALWLRKTFDAAEPGAVQDPAVPPHG